MDKLGNMAWNAERNKSGREEQTLYYITYMMDPKKLNSQKPILEQWLP